MTEFTELQTLDITDEKRCSDVRFKIKFWGGNLSTTLKEIEPLSKYKITMLVADFYKSELNFNALPDTEIIVSLNGTFVTS